MWIINRSFSVSVVEVSMKIASWALRAFFPVIALEGRFFNHLSYREKKAELLQKGVLGMFELCTISWCDVNIKKLFTNEHDMTSQKVRKRNVTDKTSWNNAQFESSAVFEIWTGKIWNCESVVIFLYFDVACPENLPLAKTSQWNISFGLAPLSLINH